MNSKITGMKNYAYEQAYLEDTISLETPIKSGFMVIYLGPTAVIEITPREYKQQASRRVGFKGSAV